MPVYSTRRARSILFVIALSSFIATFNETILNVALNPLMESFDVDSSAIQWVITLYMLVVAVMIPLAGLMYRRIPTRALVISSLVIMLGGTILGALAPNFAVLLAARVIQAIGTGITMPVTMALTLVIAPKNKLGTYMGIVSVMTTLGPSFGPVAAGFVLGIAGDWHMLFFLFGIVVAICLVCAILFVPNAAELDQPKIDIVSTVGVSLTLIGIMYGITTLFNGVFLVGFVSLAIGCVAGVLFVRRQRSIDNPVIDLSPFASGGFRAGILCMALAFMASFSMNIVIPLFLQGALATSAFIAALVLLPATLCSTIVSPLAGRVYDRRGINPLLIFSFALIIIGTFALAHLGTSADHLLITLLFVPVVIGTGIGVGPSQSFALSRLEKEKRNHGVTIVAVTLQIAGCIGSSLFVGIMGAIETWQVSLGADAISAQAYAFDITCFATCALGAIGLLLALYTVRKEAVGTSDFVLPAKPTRPAGDTSVLSQIMGPDNNSIPVTASAFDALVAMADNHTGGMPIVNTRNRVVGFITDGDVMRYLAGGAPNAIGNAQMYAWWRESGRLESDLEELKEIDAMEIAEKRIISIDIDDEIDVLVRKFADVRIKKVPVTREGSFIGTLNRSDLLLYLVKTSRGEILA